MKTVDFTETAEEDLRERRGQGGLRLVITHTRERPYWSRAVWQTRINKDSSLERDESLLYLHAVRVFRLFCDLLFVRANRY